MPSEELFSSYCPFVACPPHYRSIVFCKCVSCRGFYEFIYIYMPVLWCDMKSGVHIHNIIVMEHSQTHTKTLPPDVDIITSHSPTCALAWPACLWFYWTSVHHVCQMNTEPHWGQIRVRQNAQESSLRPLANPRSSCSWFSYLSISVFMISLYICVCVSLLCCTLFWSSYPSLPEEEAGEWN